MRFQFLICTLRWKRDKELPGGPPSKSRKLQENSVAWCCVARKPNITHSSSSMLKHIHDLRSTRDALSSVAIGFPYAINLIIIEIIRWWNYKRSNHGCANHGCVIPRSIKYLSSFNVSLILSTPNSNSYYNYYGQCMRYDLE